LATTTTNRITALQFDDARKALGLVMRLEAAWRGEPPEAEAEETPGATLYIRVPAALKERVEAAASEDELSAKAWVMRCMESCLAHRRNEHAVSSGRRCRLSGIRAMTQSPDPDYAKEATHVGHGQHRINANSVN
jgi:hypothetical protein